MQKAKRCSRCRRPRFVSEFYKDKRSSDGASSWCKACHRVSRWNKQAKTAGASKAIKNADIHALMTLQNMKCGDCDQPLPNAVDFRIQAITPLDQGGNNELINLKLVHLKKQCQPKPKPDESESKDIEWKDTPADHKPKPKRKPKPKPSGGSGMRSLDPSLIGFTIKRDENGNEKKTFSFSDKPDMDEESYRKEELKLHLKQALIFLVVLLGIASASAAIHFVFFRGL